MIRASTLTMASKVPWISSDGPPPLGCTAVVVGVLCVKGTKSCEQRVEKDTDIWCKCNDAQAQSGLSYRCKSQAHIGLSLSSL